MSHSPAASPNASESRTATCITLAAVVGLSLVAGWPLLSRGEISDSTAWDGAVTCCEVSRLAIVRDRQWPLWNPYVDGGRPLLARPETPAASPLFAIVLVLGTPLGLRVIAVMSMLIAATGTAELLRYWKAAPAGRIVGAAIYAVNAPLVTSFADGEFHWCAAALLPWVLLGILRGLGDARWVVFGGIALATGLTWSGCSAGVVFLPMLACFSACEAWKQKSWRPLAACGGVLIVGCLIAAPKLLPESELANSTANESPGRRLASHGGTDEQSGRSSARTAGQFPWRLAGNRAAAIVLGFAGLGLLTGMKLMWPLLSAVAVAGLAATERWESWGHFAVDAERFAAVPILILAVLAGVGVTWCRGRRVSRSSFRFATGCCVLLSAWLIAELVWDGHQAWNGIQPTPVAQRPVEATFATRVDATAAGSDSVERVAPVVRSGSGILLRRTVPRPIRVVGEPDYRGEIYTASGNRSLEFLEWSIGTQKIYVDAREPDRLFVNQHAAPGWSAVVYNAEEGRYEPATGHASGLISVKLRPGDREIVLRYLPERFVYGVCLAAITLLCCAAVVAIETKRQRRIRREG